MVEELSTVEKTSIKEAIDFFGTIADGLKKACVLVAEDPAETKMIFLCKSELFVLEEEEILEEPILEKPPEGHKIRLRQVEGFERDFLFQEEE